MHVVLKVGVRGYFHCKTKPLKCTQKKTKEFENIDPVLNYRYLWFDFDLQILW